MRYYSAIPVCSLVSACSVNVVLVFFNIGSCEHVLTNEESQKMCVFKGEGGYKMPNEGLLFQQVKGPLKILNNHNYVQNQGEYYYV